MPWEIRRNYGGCSGFAVVKKPDGELEGCHNTVAAAEAQMRALYASEGEMGSQQTKDVVTSEQTPNKNPQNMSASSVYKQEWEGKPLYDELSNEERALADALLALYDKVGPLNEAQGIWVGYVDEAQNENNSIGVNCGNCALHVSEVKCAILSIPIQEGGACRFAVIPDGYVMSGSDVADDMMGKAMTLDDLDLKPTESMANNARRGLELRSKFGRGGTSVGVARARDLANRKNLSPDTVARMYSFFSRHEVDKKGKDFNNPERPSNGKIAWLLWGGDSGFAWSTSKWAAIQRIRARKSENAVWNESALSLEKFVKLPE
jgi:hypothetical protein